MVSISTSVNLSRHIAFSSLLLLAACGGGGGSDPAPPPGVSLPELSASFTDLLPNVPAGKLTGWTPGSGTGATTDGVMCATSETHHAHAVVSIYLNGDRLALPEKIGLNPGCDYEVHTHHFDGIVHIETGRNNVTFTLGQFFSVWGQPLSSTGVAGLSGTPHFYAIENGKVTAVGGDPRAILLADHKEIAIVVGTAPAKLDNNRMPANP